MDMQQYKSNPAVTEQRSSLIAEHTVLRNTYMLLSMTLLFSAGCAYYAMLANFHINILFQLVGMFGLLFLTRALANSGWGIVSVFAFTGFMGLTLGPMLNMYIKGFSNGGELVMTSLGATGAIFLALSAYVLTTRKNFSYMGGFLFAALISGVILMLAAMIFQMPMLHIAISGVFVLIFSGYILYDTSQIIHGGETNYIMATVALYLDILNLFVNLLHILGYLAGNRD